MTERRGQAEQPPIQLWLHETARTRLDRARPSQRQGDAHRLKAPLGRLASDERQPLARGAFALRAGHAAIAVAELGCLGYIWTCALTGRRDGPLRGAIIALSGEGVGLMVGRGQCPLGPLQRRLGDPVPLFELVLPSVWAQLAVPILAGLSGVGIALALRPIPRQEAR